MTQVKSAQVFATLGTVNPPTPVLKPEKLLHLSAILSHKLPPTEI